MQPSHIRIRELATAPARDGKAARPGPLPVSAATVWRWVKRGEFPQPLQLGSVGASAGLTALPGLRENLLPRVATTSAAGWVSR